MTGAATGTGTSAAGSTVPPAQALTDLATALAMLLATLVTVENQAERNAEVTKLREQMAKVQADINAENARVAELQSQVHAEVERLKAEAWHLGLRRCIGL